MIQAGCTLLFCHVEDKRNGLQWLRCVWEQSVTTIAFSIRGTVLCGLTALRWMKSLENFSRFTLMWVTNFAGYKVGNPDVKLWSFTIFFLVSLVQVTLTRLWYIEKRLLNLEKSLHSLRYHTLILYNGVGIEEMVGVHLRCDASGLTIQSCGY